MGGNLRPTRTSDSAIRLWKLCALVPMFAADREHFSDRAFVNLLYSIWEHLDYLKDDDWDGGNWLSTVTNSVLDAAIGFPQYRDSARWLTFATPARYDAATEALAVSRPYCFPSRSSPEPTR